MAPSPLFPCVTRFRLRVVPFIGMLRSVRIPFLSLLFCPVLLLAVEYPTNADEKKDPPSKPEEGGLRLEVSARLDDAFESDGSGSKFKWCGAYLEVEIVVRNVSLGPITVPTTAYDGKVTVVNWPAWGEGIERIMFHIQPPEFKGKPTAYAATRFAPVVLAPGECVLLLQHGASIRDRKHADSIKEASVHFGVSRRFDGQNEWWKGNLQTYEAIVRRHDPDKEIEQMNANQERHNTESAAKAKSQPTVPPTH